MSLLKTVSVSLSLSSRVHYPVTVVPLHGGLFPAGYPALTSCRYLSYALPTGRVRHKAFLDGSRRRAVAQTRLASTKMPRGPVGIPLKKKKRGAWWLTKPLQGEVEPTGTALWGSRIPVLDTGISVRRPRPTASGTRTTPSQISVPTNRSVSQPSDVQTLCIRTCLSHWLHATF